MESIINRENRMSCGIGIFLRLKIQSSNLKFKFPKRDIQFKFLYHLILNISYSTFHTQDLDR